ncbi:hypothetical protein [Sphingomonas sp.]|jgi:hypothetical protein|uniref:hypothetical protein n=1 Tax=Sphingomonas sp. TaxID=28214 RepID=UPI002DBFB921|nr:hypothetical protein [Sphingomonas sp.]HEU4967351.1 hypothetical protein [Sphingomonas sp.]
MIFRLLNIQGIAGLAVSIALGLLLIIQKGETRHWKKQSGQFEQLYHAGEAALAGTVANYRAAAEAARAADRANLARVAAEQRAINERTSNDFEARLAAARTLAQRLRGQAASPAADRGAAGAAAVSRLSASSGGAAQAAGEDRLSLAERELATEQAIQLDELIKWIRAQAGVEPGAGRPKT